MWPEVSKAKTENRHELVLTGGEISKRINEDGLDPSIFDLTMLNYLDIHDTSLASVPDMITKLGNLQTLVLHSNKLTEITALISKLEKLKVLDLSKNELKEISEELNNLVNLYSLNLAYNKLEEFPALSRTTKLTVIDLSSNQLKTFPPICNEEFTSLSEVRLSCNGIESVPPEIRILSGLKELQLSHNKIKVLPGELADCTKLKGLGLKDNPIADKRLNKLIDQCHTKQVLDYVKQHCPRTVCKQAENNKKGAAKKKKKSQEESEDSDSEPIDKKYSIRVRYAGDNVRVVIDNAVKSVREYFVACLVNNVNFTEESFKKFIQLQNKLHETVCAKRNSSTIATHDFNKIPPGNLTYTTMSPDALKIQPLNKATMLTGAQLFTQLQTEANNLRKEKKRNTYSGIHKYLYLIEGQSKYPCLLNAEGAVISFPPITNSDVSKIDLNTKTMLIEVTSSTSLHLCKTAMESLLKEMVTTIDKDLDVTQIKTTDIDGNLRVVYPSKSDLNFDKDVAINVIRE